MLFDKQEASTLYFSGTCQLKCKYCFLPKIPSHMKRINDMIIEWIDSGKMIEDMKYIHGDQLIHIALWGGEPVINFNHIIPIIGKLFDEFPKLETFSFSTNIASENLVRLIKEFYLTVKAEAEKRNRNHIVKVQTSLDGPSEVNNCNRVGSFSSKIVENILEVFRFLVAEKVNVDNFSIHGKATMTMDNIRKFYQSPVELSNYFKFFDDMYSKINETCKVFPRTFHAISYAYPGQYTKEDGELFTKFLDLLYNKSFLFAKDLKFINDFTEQTFAKINGMLKHINRVRNRDYIGEFQAGSSCSAGRGDFGLGYNSMAHICQGTFFFDEKVMSEINDQNLITEFEEYQGYSFRNFDNFLKEKWIIPIKDDLKIARFQHNLSTFHKSIKFRYWYNYSILKELAMSGQILEKYIKDNVDFKILNMILTSGEFSCITNNIWESGSIFHGPVSIMKLLGNGAADFILDQISFMETHSE